MEQKKELMMEEKKSAVKIEMVQNGYVVKIWDYISGGYMRWIAHNAQEIFDILGKHFFDGEEGQ